MSPSGHPANLSQEQRQVLASRVMASHICRMKKGEPICSSSTSSILWLNRFSSTSPTFFFFFFFFFCIITPHHHSQFLNQQNNPNQRNTKTTHTTSPGDIDYIERERSSFFFFFFFTTKIKGAAQDLPIRNRKCYRYPSLAPLPELCYLYQNEMNAKVCIPRIDRYHNEEDVAWASVSRLTAQETRCATTYPPLEKSNQVPRNVEGKKKICVESIESLGDMKLKLPSFCSRGFSLSYI